MKENFKKNVRDINKENKMINQKKIGPFQIIMGLLIGAFFYFGYYILMTDYFKVNILKFPYLLLSIYFAFATILFPYASNKVSMWIENSSTLDFLISPVISMPFAYIFAPIVSVIGLF